MGVIACHDRPGGRLWHRRPDRGSDLLRVHQERVVGFAVDLGLSLRDAADVFVWIRPYEEFGFNRLSRYKAVK